MIQDSVNKVIYEGNGQATEFFYPFEITKNTDVKVMTVSLDGVETVLTNDYFVDVEKSIVLYPGWAEGESPPNADDYLPLADGWKLVIYRDVPYTQEVGMFEQYPFNVLEGMIDKTTILAQQLKDEAQRSMRLGVAVDNTDISMVVPHGQGTSFRWSDDGKRLEVTEDPAEVKRAVEQMASTVAEQTRTATESANTAVDSATSAKESAEKAQAAADGVATGQVQADWSEDSTLSKAYIKNKPNVQYIRMDGVDYPQTKAEWVEGAAKTADLDKVKTSVANLSQEVDEVSSKTDDVEKMITENIAYIDSFVVESWRSDDGLSWYRKYSDGWIEQGGYTSTTTATYPLPFANTDYTLLTGSNRGGSSNSGNFNYITKWSETGFTHALDSNQKVWWYAVGKGAE